MRKNLIWSVTWGINAEDMYNMLKGSGINLDKRDLLPYSYPEKKEF